MIFDALTRAIERTKNPTCVGLDTSFDYLPSPMKEGANTAKERMKAVFSFNRNIIDAVIGIVPAVKVQIAYYEVYGAAGIECFVRTCAYAKEKGLFVIADCKRNDIGTTASQYARAYFGEEAFAPVDLLTVNGYLGTDGVRPFAELCEKHDKGIFVLVKTSNPSSGELQDLTFPDGTSVYERMGDLVNAWGGGTEGECGYTRVGAVVGATYPEEAKKLRLRMPHAFFLVPGYGAQGGNASMLTPCFHEGGRGAIVNNSRGILCAYQKRGGDYAEAARVAAIDMRADLLSALGGICER